MRLFCECGRKAIFGRFGTDGRFHRGARRDHDLCRQCFQAFVDRRRPLMALASTGTTDIAPAPAKVEVLDPRKLQARAILENWSAIEKMGVNMDGLLEIAKALAVLAR